MSYTENWNRLLAAAEGYQSRRKQDDARAAYEGLVACFNEAAPSFGDLNEMERQELRELIAELESQDRPNDLMPISFQGQLADLRSRLAESEQKQEVAPAPPIGWRLLGVDAEARRALLVAESVVAMKPFHHGASVWAGCDLRGWVNGEFAEAAFSAWQLDRVALTSVENPANPESGLEGGPATEDRIFLLSIAEAEQLFASDEDRIATWQGYAVWWWLRSPGDLATAAAGVIPNGMVDRDGDYVYIRGGVRPALYLDLQPVES